MDLFSNAHGNDPDTANARYLDLATELRTLLFAATRANSPEPLPTEPSNQPCLISQLIRSPGLLTPAKVAQYMRIWSTECAPWLDMFDQDQAFGLEVPCLAQRSPPVLYAMLALSARTLERSPQGLSSSNSIELYSEAIAGLSAALDARDPCVLVTACILCVLEMMSASPADWRHHLEGSAALFAAAGVHGLSSGLPQAVFWCYARMDVCNAIISDADASTVLPLSKWICAGESGTVREAIREQYGTSPDMHANYMVYLTAQVCDLLAERTRHDMTSDGACHDEVNTAAAWQDLWDEIQRWYKERPAEMLPISTSHGSGPFPCALYAHNAAISSTQLFHTACILMLDMYPHEIGRPPMDPTRKKLFHARCVVGISMTNLHKGCLNNAVQPLYVAGRLFSHREEQVVVVELLKLVEASSGWAARWRIPHLEIAWGYRPGTFSSNSVSLTETSGAH